MEKIQIFKAVLAKDTHGIESIALVDAPAMLNEWLMFSEQKESKFIFQLNEEQRIITAPVIIPELPIYRKDSTGREFYVIYDKETNMNVLQKYMSEGRQNAVKLTHNEGTEIEGVQVFEMFMSDNTRGIKAPEGYKDLHDGTIFCSMKFHNDSAWQLAKEGKINGVSLEGYFGLEPFESLTDTEVNAIIDAVIN